MPDWLALTLTGAATLGLTLAAWHGWKARHR